MTAFLSSTRVRDDDGLTLVELLVTMTLGLVVSSLMVSAMVGTSRLLRHTDAEAAGQTDVRATIERLGRDLRNSRSLDQGATGSQLVLWVDSNSDYREQASEIVTWRLVAGTGGHFDVARVVNGVTKREARLVISNLAFCYRVTSSGPCLAMPLTLAQANSVRVVNSDILYAADATRPLAVRHAVFSERMRNVS